MFGLGPTEIIIVGIVMVVLFGKRLPSVARSIGTSFREFQNSLKGDE
jgi:sec-independent protein translocase protein TatA